MGEQIWHTNCAGMEICVGKFGIGIVRTGDLCEQICASRGFVQADLQIQRCDTSVLCAILYMGNKPSDASDFLTCA